MEIPYSDMLLAERLFLKMWSFSGRTHTSYQHSYLCNADTYQALAILVMHCRNYTSMLYAYASINANLACPLSIHGWRKQEVPYPIPSVAGHLFCHPSRGGCGMGVVFITKCPHVQVRIPQMHAHLNTWAPSTPTLFWVQVYYSQFTRPSLPVWGILVLHFKVTNPSCNTPQIPRGFLI